MTIDFSQFIKNNTLLLIRIQLEELPMKLDNLTKKAYYYIKNDFSLLKQQQKDFYNRLKDIPEIIGYDENGDEISNHDWLSSQAEDNFINDAEIIEYFETSIHSMLINFYYETYTNLKKQIKDQLKNIDSETNSLSLIFDEIYNTLEIQKVNLINNCIKHNNCIADKKLANKFPTEFKENAQITINKALVYSLLQITKQSFNQLKIKFIEKYSEK